MTVSFFSRVLGYDPKTVKRQPQASRMKVVRMGVLLSLPVMVWAIAGSLMALRIFHASWQIAAIAGIVCAVLIFIIDRSFITDPASKGLTPIGMARLGFAVLSGIMGAVAIDLTFFHDDIADYQRKTSEVEFEVFKEAYIAKYAEEFAKYQTAVDRAELDFGRAERAYENEMNGIGAGGTGYGPIAKRKDILRENAVERLNSRRVELNAFADRIDTDAGEYAEIQSDKSNAGIMGLIHDFHRFVFDSRINMAFYFLFFLLLFFIETIPLLMKMFGKTSAFEQFLVEEERVHLERMDALRKRKARYHHAVGELGVEEVGKIRGLAG